MPDLPLLAGERVRLEDLTDRHVDDLTAAAGADRDTYSWTPVPHGRDAMAASVAEFAAGHAAGAVVPLAQVRVADGRAVGVTTLLNLRTAPGRSIPWAAEIGSTWLGATAQRTGINVEAKLLLLTHLFDTWGCERVDIKTDARNERARTAIAALGVTFEGVLRAWQPSGALGEEGRTRDTAMYSVIPAEWPRVRAHLEARLLRP